MSATHHCKCGRERFQDEPACSFCIGAALDALLAVVRDKVVPALQAAVAAVQEFEVKPDVTVDDFCAAQATVNAAIAAAATHGTSDLRKLYGPWKAGQERGGHPGFIRHGGVDYAVLFEETIDHCADGGGCIGQLDGRVCGDPLPAALVGDDMLADAYFKESGLPRFTVRVLDNRTVRSNGPYTLPAANPVSGSVGCEHGWSNATSIRDKELRLHRRTCDYCGMIQVATHKTVILGDPDWKQVRE